MTTMPCVDCGTPVAGHGFCNDCLKARYGPPTKRGGRWRFDFSDLTRPADAADLHGAGWVAATSDTAVRRALRQEGYRQAPRDLSPDVAAVARARAEAERG